MRKYFFLLPLILLAACEQPADVASRNLSQAADNFQIARRIVFYNGITDAYMLTIEGLCALDLTGGKNLKVTCKTGHDEYKKHYLGLSDNVTYFAEQLSGASVSTYQYKVTFRPTTIIPDIRMDIGK
jgi:hypothetical protein